MRYLFFRQIYCAILLVLVSPVILAQDNTLQNIETQAVQEDIELIENNSIQEDLEHLKKHPLSLNRAKREDLLQLPGMNDILISNLHRHIAKCGPLHTIYELQVIDGFQLQLIQQILPYIYVNEENESNPLTATIKENKQQLAIISQRKLEQAQGFRKYTAEELSKSPGKYYIGDPWKICLRYRFNANEKIAFGLLAEKDAGETFRPIDSLNKKAGFDFYSGYIALKNMGVFSSILIGHYQAGFGQGLVVWSGFSPGKSNSFAGIKRNAGGLKPYKGADENNFLQGIATSIRFRKITLSVFSSLKNKDANLILKNDNPSFSRFVSGGSHATLPELKDKHSVMEYVNGLNISLKKNNFSIGLTAQHQYFNKPLMPENTWYNQFQFRGSSNFNYGLDLNYAYQNMYFFGEAAACKNGSTAYITGCLVALDPKVNLSMSYRNYSRLYQNLMANAVSEGSATQNEKGIYLGLECLLNKNISLTAYTDHFYFSWMKYNLAHPASGNDASIQLQYHWKKTNYCYLRYHSNNAAQNQENGMAYLYPSLRKQRNFRWHLAFEPIPNLELQQRIEYVWVLTEHKPIATGLLLFSDLSYTLPGKKVKLSARYTNFDSNDYSSRIYTYEHDLPYTWYVPSFSGKGSKFYLLFGFPISKHLSSTLKFSRTVYFSPRLTDSPAPSFTPQLHNHEVKWMINYNF